MPDRAGSNNAPGAGSAPDTIHLAMAVVLFPLPAEGFEPTEAAVPWRALRDAGHEVRFATPRARPAACDPLALSGVVFGTIGARPGDAAIYREMEADSAFSRPIAWDDVDVACVDAVHLTGGHAPGMRPYLESTALMLAMRQVFAAGKPVSAVCHGPVLLARTTDPRTGASVLAGRRVTALPRAMERTAWWLTRWRLGDHFRTYPTWVQDEVSAAVGPDGTFETGPFVPSYRRSFTVRDGNLLTARWPGDVQRLARDLVAMLAESAAGARAPASASG